MRDTGTVKFFNATKGFGFIQQEEGDSKDVLRRRNRARSGRIRSLNEGDKVTFVLEDDRRGRGKQAGQIEIGLRHLGRQTSGESFQRGAASRIQGGSDGELHSTTLARMSGSDWSI